MRTSAILVMSLFFRMCSEPVSPDLPQSRLPVSHIASVTLVGRSLTFELVCTVPEAGCWRFLRTDHVTNNRSHAISIQGQRTTGNPCGQVLGSINVTTNITVDGPGVHSFSFWSNDKSVDTTLTVP